jgi:coenzyme F420-reducing hydrogenase beta subunit
MTGKRRIDGDEIITSEEGFDLSKELARREGEGSERCDLCCIMLANKSDVIHLSL